MKPSDIFSFDYLKSYVLSLMPAPPVQYSVAQEQQQGEIESLKATLGGKRFFFVNNLENFETEQVHGVAQWLGYSEKTFTMKWYLDHVVHPGKRKTIILVGKQLYDNLCMGKHKLNFMVQRYSSLVALRHYKGHYLLANKISSVFQYDENNRLTAYLNEFTIIGEYTGQPLGPDFFTEDGSPDPRGAEILQQTLDFFFKLKIFSPQQLQVARCMAYEPGIKQADIADRLDILKTTVKEYGDRFKENVNDFFHQDFRNAVDAAIFIRKEGLL